MDTTVRDADWSVEHSVGLIPVGDIRIDYLRDPVDRGQSTDAVSLTELLLFYTLRSLRNCCAEGYIPCWTFCDTVWNLLRVEGLLLRRGAFQTCRAMEGAVPVVNRSGFTFDAELCIPWDAPKVVADVSSTEAFTPVPPPHRVVLLSREEDVDDRRILSDGDSRVVRFRNPEVYSANRESCDAKIVVMEEAEEPPISEVTKDSSAGNLTLGTTVQSPVYTVPEEVTVGANWTPDCTPALPTPAMRRESQPRLTTWPLLCPHPSMIVLPVVGAGLAENNNGAAIVTAAEGYPPTLL